MTAADAWRESLAQWAIPDHITRDAPNSPHGFSVETFTALAAQALAAPLTPTHRRALEALPDAGNLTDVGCGGGAGSLPLVQHSKVGSVTGVDQSAGMLAAFAAAAQRLGIAAATVEGEWPAVADQTPVADVVVCLHVVYNVPELVAFTQALTSHARQRVVLEFPTVHPLTWLAPYWRAVHGIQRPDHPTADDALTVFTDLGCRTRHERWLRPLSMSSEPVEAQVGFLRQRLALSADSDQRLRSLIAQYGIPAQREVVTAWWDV